MPAIPEWKDMAAGRAKVSPDSEPQAEGGLPQSIVLDGWDARATKTKSAPSPGADEQAPSPGAAKHKKTGKAGRSLAALDSLSTAKKR